MTDVVTSSALGLPGGNGSQALFFNSVNLGWSDVEEIIIVFPPGCAGLVGVRIEYAVNPVYPTPAGSYFIFDNYTHVIRPTGQPKGGQWRIVGYNQDTFFHTIQSYWGWNYLPGQQQGNAATLISL